jgi:hypothetical protein
LDNLQQIRKITRLLIVIPMICVLFRVGIMVVGLINFKSAYTGEPPVLPLPSASAPGFPGTIVSFIDRWGHLSFYMVGAVIIWLVYRYTTTAAPAREKQLASLANDLGMGFTDECPTPPIGPPYYCPSLPEGDRRARNIIEGEIDGLKVTMCDLIISKPGMPSIYGDEGHQQTESTDAVMEGLSVALANRSSIMSVSTIVLESKLHYKPLVIWPESVSSRVPLSMGLHNVDFEYDDFNKAFFVGSTDKKFAYDVVHPRMMALLMANKNWAVELDLNALTVWNFRPLSPQEFRDGLSFARSFWELFPEYLKQDLSNRGSV